MRIQRETKLAVAVVSLLVTVVGAAIWLRREHVKTVVATRGHAADVVFASGSVEPVSRVMLKARVIGTVQGCDVREGDAIKKGDILCRIEDPRWKRILEGRKAELNAAKENAGDDSPQLAILKALGSSLRAELGAARGELGRVQSLVRSGALPAAELDRLRSRVAQLNAQAAANAEQQRASKLEMDTNLSRAEQSHSGVSQDVEDGQVKAPFDGVVVRRFVELGQTVAPGEPIVEVADNSSYVVQLSVDESDVAAVKGDESGGTGSAVAVRFPAFKGQVFSGHVERVSPDADRHRGGFAARARLNSPPAGLRSGMRAEANIVTSESAGALLIPAEAVSDNRVWVVRNGRLEPRKIKVGLRDVASVEVVDGLGEGEEVVLHNAPSLSSGDLVVADAVDYFGAGGGRGSDIGKAVASLDGRVKRRASSRKAAAGGDQVASSGSSKMQPALDLQVVDREASGAGARTKTVTVNGPDEGQLAGTP